MDGILRQKFFRNPPGTRDRDVLFGARMTAVLKPFMETETSDVIPPGIEAAVLGEFDRLVREGVIDRRPDWLAVLHGGRLNVAFGTEAVIGLSRELKRTGAFV